MLTTHKGKKKGQHSLRAIDSGNQRLPKSRLPFNYLPVDSLLVVLFEFAPTTSQQTIIEQL